MYMNVLGNSTRLSLRIYRCHSHSDISNEYLMIIGCSFVGEHKFVFIRLILHIGMGSVHFCCFLCFSKHFYLQSVNIQSPYCNSYSGNFRPPSAVLIRPPLPLPWPACSAPNHIFPFSGFHFFICLFTFWCRPLPPPTWISKWIVDKKSFVMISNRKTKGNSNSESVGRGRIRWSRLRCSPGYAQASSG